MGVLQKKPVPFFTVKYAPGPGTLEKLKSPGKVGQLQAWLQAWPLPHVHEVSQQIHASVRELRQRGVPLHPLHV